MSLRSLKSNSKQWQKGQVVNNVSPQQEIQDTILSLTDPLFLQQTLTQSKKMDQLQQTIKKSGAIFAHSQDQFYILSKLLFSPHLERKSGLLGLTATRSMVGSDSIHVCSLAENIMESLMTQGWFQNIINFKNFRYLQGGRCGILSTEVLEWISRKQGLLDLIHRHSDSALLLLYYFLSVDYEGAFAVWNAFACFNLDTIRKLCLSLTGYMLRGSLDETKDENSIVGFAYHLLKHFVDKLGWFVSDNRPNSNTEQVPMTLRTFSTKFNVPSLPIFLFSSPRPVDPAKPDQHLNISIWEERFLALERTVSEEKIRNQKLEAQLVQAMSSISSIQTQLSQKKQNKIVPPRSEQLPEVEEFPLVDTPENFDPLSSPIVSDATSSTSSVMHSSSSILRKRGAKERSFSTPRHAEHPDDELSDEDDHVPSSDNVTQGKFTSDFGMGKEWFGMSHPDCASPDSYALLQRDDGQYTIINKKPGRGNIAFSVGHEPQVVIDPQGNMGIGTTTPRSKLHVEGSIKCGQSSYCVLGLEQLTVLRGGFSCRTCEPRKGPGWQLQTFENGVFEIRFAHPFSKRPSVFAVQHVPQETPSLICLGFVDPAKFGFVKVASRAEVWVEFFVFGQRAAGWL